jgi:hypothetical protein
MACHMTALHMRVLKHVKFGIRGIATDNLV